MYKILIVDDEKLLRQGFIHMTNWAEHGFSIAGEAANGEEALQLIETIEPEIVITDIRMPVMDGIVLTRKIKEFYPQIQVIVLSSYNDFEYVRETLKLGALDYFLKPKMEPQELLALLEKTKQKLDEFRLPDCNFKYSFSGNSREKFFKDLLSGKFEDGKLTKQQLDHIEVNLKDTDLVLVIIFPIQSCGADPIEAEETIQNQFASLFNGHTIFFNGAYVTLINSDPSQLGQIESIGSQLIDLIAQRKKIVTRIIISDFCKKLTAIGKTYCQAIQKRPYLFYKQIILPNQIFNTTILECGLEPLQLFVEKQDLQGLNRYVVAQITERIRTDLYPEPYDLKKWLIEICFLVIQSLTKLGYNTTSINKNKFSFFKKIEGANSLVDVLITFDGIMSDFETLLAAVPYHLYNPIIKQIIDYLAGHYTENISLATLADLFHVNKSYLCQLFKQQTGQNFNEYLTKIRIERAKELLLHPENNINTVGNLVGFSNPSYFAQVFKNLVRITPSEYVKLRKTAR